MENLKNIVSGALFIGLLGITPSNSIAEKNTIPSLNGYERQIWLKAPCVDTKEKIIIENYQSINGNNEIRTIKKEKGEKMYLFFMKKGEKRLSLYSDGREIIKGDERIQQWELRQLNSNTKILDIKEVCGLMPGFKEKTTKKMINSYSFF